MKKLKKSTGLTVALLIYVSATAAYFLSRTVTIEPAVYWDINKDRSEFGLKVGFGFYF